MKSALSWVVGLPVAVAIIVIVAANRQLVTFSLDPFSQSDPWFAVETPLYVLIAGAVMLGMLAGATSTWFAQGKWRKAAREAWRELRRIEADKQA
ncbi:MAG: LapA family protein [Hyphomicrobiales bacterium]